MRQQLRVRTTLHCHPKALGCRLLKSRKSRGGLQSEASRDSLELDAVEARKLEHGADKHCQLRPELLGFNFTLQGPGRFAPAHPAKDAASEK